MQALVAKFNIFWRTKPWFCFGLTLAFSGYCISYFGEHDQLQIGVVFAILAVGCLVCSLLYFGCQTISITLAMLFCVQLFAIMPTLVAAKNLQNRIQTNQATTVLQCFVTSAKQNNQGDFWQSEAKLTSSSQFGRGAKIMLHGKGAPPKLGAYYEIKGSLRLPESQRNPGGFSEKSWLMPQGIYGVIDKVELSYVGISYRPFWILSRYFADVKARFSNYLQRYFPKAEGSLLKGLLYGETDDFSPWQKYAFASAGMAHITAVSGANVAFILMPLWHWQKKRKTRTGIRLIVNTSVLLLYGFIAGWSAGVSRAIIGAIVYLWLVYWRCRVARINIIGIVATSILIFRPLWVRQLSFQLSFLAFLAVVVVAQWHILPFETRQKLVLWRRMLGVCKIPLTISFVVMLITLPLQLELSASWFILGWLFGMIGLALSELVTWTAAACLTLFAVINCVGLSEMGLMQNLQGLIFDVGVAPWLRLINNMATLGSSLPGLVSYRSTSWFIVLLICTLLVVLAWRRQAKWRWRFSYKMRITVVCVILLFGGLAVAYKTVQQGFTAPWQIIQLDVGQGDSALLLEKSGFTALIDGGVQSNGIGTILPAMRYYGRGAVDLAVLSHYDLDHSGGIIELIRLGRVKKLIISQELAPKISELQKIASSNPFAPYRCDIAVASRGDEIQLVPKTLGSLIVLAPEAKQELSSKKPTSNNANSLVVSFLLGQKAWLFTGDIGADEERYLALDKKVKWAGLKVAHHGSRYSSSETWLNQNHFDHAVISCGRYNRYGHPAPATVERLQQSVGSIWRTDTMGAIEVNIYADSVTVITPYKEKN